MEETPYDKELIEEIFDKEPVLKSITHDLGKLLTDLLQANGLESGDGLMLVARLSAVYVHIMQSDLKTAAEKDALEDAFYEAFQMYLAHFDINSLYQVGGKIKKDKLN